MEAGVELGEETGVAECCPRPGPDVVRHGGAVESLIDEAETALDVYHVADGGSGQPGDMDGSGHSGFVLDRTLCEPVAEELEDLILSPGVDLGGAAFCDRLSK
jgi:hypothetical protein